MPKVLIVFIYGFTLLKIIIVRVYINMFQMLYVIIGYLILSTWNPLYNISLLNFILHSNIWGVFHLNIS